MRQQLDTGADRGPLAWWHHFFGQQDTIDPIAHVQSIVKRLQMDIRRPKLDHATDDGVYQANNGRFACQVAKVLDEVAGVALKFTAFAIPLSSGRLFQQPGQCLVDFARNSDRCPDLQPTGQVERLKHKFVVRRSHDDFQLVV